MVAKRVLPRLRECSRQVEAEVVSNSSNKIHQTWEALFWRPLYILSGVRIHYRMTLVVTYMDHGLC